MFAIAFFCFTVLTLIMATSCSEVYAQPAPGEVFREYMWYNETGDAGESLRVGGKHGETHPDRGWAHNYINAPVVLDCEFDLENATKAEVVIEKILCHDGTTGLAIQVNDNDWIKIPEAEKIPSPQCDYQHHIYPAVPIPPSCLKAGRGNEFRMKVDADHPWKWPQNLIYGVHFRIYYDPSKKPHPTGGITAPSSGDMVGRSVELRSDAQSPDGEIEQVDYIGYYEDVNFEGDGEYQQWHYHFFHGKILHHLGTANAPPYSMIWDTSWVPDQKQPMKIAARIIDNTGMIYFTESVNDLELLRPGLSVELCKPYNIPKKWVTRKGEKQENFDVTGDLNRAIAAQLVWVSWSPGYMNGIYVNGKEVFHNEGPKYRYYAHRITIDDLSMFKRGVNTLSTGGSKGGHGMEVNWPGIMVLIQYETKRTEDNGIKGQMMDSETYFPPPDSEGGWRTLTDADDILRITGVDKRKLDEAFEFAKGTTKNGGLLVVRKGWLVYERYFGKGHREATPNLASCGKSFTSIAVGILMEQRPELFPDGLEQKVFTPVYLPPEAFPLSDPAKADIKLGQLLAFTAGIRGNNPSYVHGKEVNIDPIGPDGWQALVDAAALGKQDGRYSNGVRYTTSKLWCKPGGGYSYATAAIHLASIMLRHITGMELQDFVERHLAKPMGWGRWNYAYRHAREVAHTPGGGGIALRATDMLRFGYMLLHEGRWADQQLIPAEYIRHCALQSPYNPHYPYSLQFTVNSDSHVPELPRDAFWKAGSGGHIFYVVPSLELVVWKLGGRDDQYSQKNTGLPEVATQDDTREDWETSGLKGNVLQMVIDAIQEQ